MKNTTAELLPCEDCGHPKSDHTWDSGVCCYEDAATGRCIACNFYTAPGTQAASLVIADRERETRRTSHPVAVEGIKLPVRYDGQYIRDANNRPVGLGEAGQIVSALNERNSLKADLATANQQLAEYREIQFSPTGDNHHNAALCPHCGDPLRAAVAEKDRWRLALESLTPGGSEYVNDLDKCLNHVLTQRMDEHKRLVKAIKGTNALKIALADAIRRPMGHLPDSARGLLTDQELADAEARRVSDIPLVAAIYHQDQDLATVTAERDAMQAALVKIIMFGHNNDCLFCGFKDKFVNEALNRSTSPADEPKSRTPGDEFGPNEYEPDGAPIESDAKFDQNEARDKMRNQFDG